jgi:hypothetical protein
LHSKPFIVFTGTKMEITIKLNTDEASSVEIDAILTLLATMKTTSKPEENRVEIDELLELTDNEIDQAAEKMLDLGLDYEEGKILKTSELYRLTSGGSLWKKLHPNSRKSIGRRFRKLATDHSKEAHSGQAILSFQGRSVQNMAMYKVDVAPEKEH